MYGITTSSAISHTFALRSAAAWRFCLVCLLVEMIRRRLSTNSFCQTSGSTLYCWRPSIRMIPHLPRSKTCSTSSSIREEKPLTTDTSFLRAICAAHSRVGSTDSVEIWLGARNATLCFCNKVALPICCCVSGIIAFNRWHLVRRPYDT